MRNYWLPVVLMIGLSASACKEEKPPIPQMEMAKILADMHVADAASALVPMDTPKRHGLKNDDSLAIWTAQILQKHHKTLEEFNAGLKWYRDRPIELDSLFGKVIPILEKERR